jgi:hypothetical protein
MFLVMLLGDFELENGGVTMKNGSYHTWRCATRIACDRIYDKVIQGYSMPIIFVVHHASKVSAVADMLPGNAEQVTELLTTRQIDKLSAKELLNKAVKFEQDPLNYSPT